MIESIQRIKIHKILFRRPVLTVSNLLCLVRLGLLPFVFHFLIQHENAMALLLIAFGSLTDFLDGFLARRLRQTSELGKILDPIVDKSTTIIVLAFLTYRNFQDYATYPLILTFGTCFLFLMALVYLVAFPLIVRKNGEIPSSNMPGKVTVGLSLVTLVLYILELHPWADGSMVLTIGMSLAASVLYFLRDFHTRQERIKIGWANRATLLRIFLAPLFLLIFFYDGNSTFEDNNLLFKSLALFLSIAFVVSDRIDGVLARSRNEITKLGKLLDPFADKIALMTIFLCFIATDWATVWMVALIYYREATISFLRTLAATERIVLAAQPSGKIKTVVQSVTVITLLSFAFLREIADVSGLVLRSPQVFDVWDTFWTYIPYGFMILATIVSIASGIDYLWLNRKVIKSALQSRE